MAEQIITKVCSQCKAIKQVSEFYKEPRNKSGLTSQCKVCHYKKCRQYLKTGRGHEINAEAKRKYKKSQKGKEAEKRYRSTEKRKKVKLRYNRSPKGRIAALKSAKFMNKKYPEQVKARNAVNYAVRKGDIPAPNTLKCSCGKQSRDYHHHLGYEPEHFLDVVPICSLCHKHIA